MKSIVNFLFEVGMLAKTPRTGFHFLGSGKQSVAEHVHRTIYIGYVLSTLEGNVDTERVLKMCLFHDLAEARTSDLNYLHQKYARTNEDKALHDLADTLGFGRELLSVVAEFNQKKTKEAIVAHDADQLESILSLKEEVDTGNKRAESWIASTIKRLKTESAKKIAIQILETPSDDWWFSDKKDRWWVDKGE